MPCAAAILPLLLAATGLPASHAASQTAAPADIAADHDIVTTQLDRFERMTVPVTVTGQGPFRFLVDTGSQNTVISTALAARLALAPTSRATLVSMGGRRPVDTVALDEIALGSRTYPGLLVPLLEDDHIGADGIIGLDSLQGQRVLIDFGKNTMTIADAKSLGGDRGYEIVVTARRLSGQLIMTNARIDGVNTQVVIDTGAESSVGNRALQRALARRMSAEQTVLTDVTGQRLIADMGTGRSLTIGAGTITNVVIAFADAVPFRVLDLEKRPALLLGMRELRVFRRVAIDFSSRRILFDVPAGMR